MLEMQKKIENFVHLKFKHIYFTWIVKQAKPILITLHGTDVQRIFNFFYGGGNRRTQRKPCVQSEY